VLVGSGNHGKAFLHLVRERLLAVNVLPGGAGILDETAVLMVRRGDDDCVDILPI
jgi:hypothetical protein